MQYSLIRITNTTNSQLSGIRESSQPNSKPINPHIKALDKIKRTALSLRAIPSALSRNVGRMTEVAPIPSLKSLDFMDHLVP